MDVDQHDRFDELDEVEISSVPEELRRGETPDEGEQSDRLEDSNDDSED
jgi:hypothetical protein